MLGNAALCRARDLCKGVGEMKFRYAAAALCLGTMMYAAPSAAGVFIIDDFNTSTLYTAPDNTAGNGPVTANATPITAGNIVWGAAGGGAGATRTISADLGVGDNVTANICPNCQEGEHVSGNNSTGNTAFIYTGNAVDISGFHSLMLRYDADLAGGIVQFTFNDSLANMAAVSTAALAAGVTNIMLALPIGVDYSQLTSARIDIFGVQELDVGIDDFKVVPEPGMLALFGLGLAGIAVTVRRKRKVA